MLPARNLGFLKKTKLNKMKTYVSPLEISMLNLALQFVRPFGFIILTVPQYLRANKINVLAVLVAVFGVYAFYKALEHDNLRKMDEQFLQKIQPVQVVIAKEHFSF